MSDDLSARLAHYLAPKLGAKSVAVTGLSRIPGGASRETYRFRARYTRDGQEIERGLILRRDPTASLINTERTTEFRAYRAFHRLGLPVPEAIALELGSEALDRPFFIMEEIENCAVASILAPDPYGVQAPKIGQQFFSILGQIAKADPDKIGLSDFDGVREDSWKHEIARWEREIDEDEREPQPIVRAAIRWLKRNPPPRAQKLSVVHGDYRTGNFLYDSDGNIRAILDWEMAHLGDPLEDLGWALDPLWSHHDPARPAGLLPRAEAIRIWEETSGLKADPAALHWWEIFASFKGAAIWISAGREYVEARNADPVNAFSGWYCLAFHNQVLAERLSREAA
ncbi:MAG TPA: phosphotransferase family protein [Rhizomicrobium sp.]|nr:phosphotransferase family protein [Rhizomicrobium sp.]